MSADGQTFLGYGEYLGEFDCERLKRCFGVKSEILNPKIRMDDGREMWGCECWWGNAEKFVTSGTAEKYGAPVEWRKA